jgi:glutamine synthetase
VKQKFSVSALFAPTTDSYRRLVPGHETATNLVNMGLSALDKDHNYLLNADVFTADVIETWLGYKRERELDAVRLGPYPYETSFISTLIFSASEG